jgi:hypothetical protein
MGAPNQNQNTAPVVMDARKFVRHINNGAAAKLKFFEEAVARLGESAGRKLRLTSVDTSTLIYEDVDRNRYYIAEIKKGTGGQVSFENIRPIQVIEEEKGVQFTKNCQELVESIASDKYKDADRTFGRIESQRYRSRVIPESAWITLKDGVARKVPVDSRIVKEGNVQRIVKLFLESISDNVQIDKGRIVRGTITESSKRFVVPINEYTRRRLVARQMRTVAENAFKSSAFQNFIVEVASLVCEGKVADACKLAAKFLREEQEFCMLDSKGMSALVENTLAIRGEFNSMLSNDVANLLTKTNLKVNKDTILEAWTRAAQKAENASLLHNVDVLSESDDFEQDFDEFLNLVFNEDKSTKETRAKVYGKFLMDVKDAIENIKDEDEELTTSVEELQDLVDRLQGPEADDAAIRQAEEIASQISDTLLDQPKDLEDFDAEPEGEEMGPEGAEGDEAEVMPLPEVGGDEEETMEGDMPPMPPKKKKPMPPMGGMPESKQPQFTPIEKMALPELIEELESWKLHGDNYIAEDGYQDCSAQMERYIKRCLAIGPSADTLRETFEQMRDQIVETGTTPFMEDTSDSDPYADILNSVLSGPKVKDPEADPAFWGRKETVARESRINRDYRHVVAEAGQPYSDALVDKGLDAASNPLEMDDLQGDGGVADKTPTKSDGRGVGGEKGGFDQPQRGTGVQKKGTKPTDGRKGDVAAASGYAKPEKGLRMDDLQGKGGVADKGMKTSDGRKGGTVAEATEGNPGMIKGGKGVGLRMDELQGGDSIQDTGVTKGKTKDTAGGADAAEAYTLKGGDLKAAKLRMDDLRGKGGVCELHPKEDCHCNPMGSADNEGDVKPAKRGDAHKMGQKGKGVAEGLTPEELASLIEEEEISEAWGPGNKLYDYLEKNGKLKGKKADAKKDEAEAPVESGDEAEEEVEESQYKGPSRRFRQSGMKRAAMVAKESEGDDDLSDLDAILDALNESGELSGEVVEESEELPSADEGVEPVDEAEAPADEEVKEEVDLESKLDQALSEESCKCPKAGACGKDCKCPDGCKCKA